MKRRDSKRRELMISAAIGRLLDGSDREELIMMILAMGAAIGEECAENKSIPEHGRTEFALLVTHELVKGYKADFKGRSIAELLNDEKAS